VTTARRQPARTAKTAAKAASAAGKSSAAKAAGTASDGTAKPSPEQAAESSGKKSTGRTPTSRSATRKGTTRTSGAGSGTGKSATRKSASPGAAAADATITSRRPADVIVLAGPPGMLKATVSVENAVDQRVAVRGLTLHRSGQQAVTGGGAALIAPGATAHLPVSFRLEPGTAPGEYPAEVEVGGIRREAVLLVAADLSLHVSPRRLLAEVGSTPVTLSVTNDGNVELPLAAVVRARTDDGGPDPGPDVTLTLDAATTAAPGTTTVVQGDLVVPTGLDPTRRHTARVPVGTADLDVIILPRDPSE